MSHARTISMGVLLVATLAGAGRASAVDCLTLPKPVYVTGSSAAKPILAHIARILAEAVPPTTVIYKNQGSCAAVRAIVEGGAIAGAGAEALSHWDHLGMERKCDVSPTPAGGMPVDLGISDVFAPTCLALPGGLPANVADFMGPIQTMTFVVPRLSADMAISAEAAYYVFGFGAASGVPPWTDPGSIFHFDALSTTQQMVAMAIGVPAHVWRGTVTSSNDDLKAKIMAATPRTAIGILSAEASALAGAPLRVLAYQHTGQPCGSTPDRMPTSREKGNVRDGFYALWGPLHMFTRLGTSGAAANASATDVIDYFTGTRKSPPGLDLIAVEALNHVVPPCAMRVKRTQEMGPIQPFQPTNACGCYFDKVAVGQTTCQPCQRPTDCPTAAPVCSYGYCEPK